MRSPCYPRKTAIFTLILILILIITLISSGCIYDPEKAKVIDVEKDSPAHDNGVRKGMIITHISYTLDNNATTESINGCDRIRDILGALLPGSNITLGIEDDEDRREITNITLGETDKGKAYLGIECGPTSGFFFDTVYIFGYILLIVILAVLIFIISAIEKWIERKKERKGKATDR